MNIYQTLMFFRVDFKFEFYLLTFIWKLENGLFCSKYKLGDIFRCVSLQLNYVVNGHNLFVFEL